MRAARLRVNIRSMLAHDSNTLTVLAAYLSRANASDDLTTPPAAHPALTLQQATVRGRPTVSLRELTRAVVHAIDSCTQDGDDDFVAALELASGSPLSQNVAQRLRQLMAKARDEAGREKRRLLRALHFLQNRHRFTAGAAGAEEVGEEEMRAAREAAQNPNELPADLPNRVREIAEWLIGEREASNLQGPPGFRERGGEPAYEFQELAGVAFVLLAARSVSLMGRYQASVESRFSRVLSSFLSDLDRGGRRNYQATGVRLLLCVCVGSCSLRCRFVSVACDWKVQDAAWVAFVLLVARSVILMGRYQAAVESHFSRVLSRFLSDLDQRGSNYQATGFCSLRCVCVGSCY
jgi:hypothetical protein